METQMVIAIVSACNPVSAQDAPGGTGAQATRKVAALVAP